MIPVDDGREPSGYTKEVVREDGTQYLRQRDGCPDCVLFICWPRVIDDWLATYRGRTVIWIGEHSGVTDHICPESTSAWTESARCLMPRWLGMHDVCVAYERS